MIRKTNSPFYAALAGALVGWLLLFVIVLVICGENPVRWVDWTVPRVVNWDLTQQFMLYPFVIGGFSGGIIGASLWTVLTSRHVPTIFLVLAWWLLGVGAAIIFGVGVSVALISNASMGRDGSGAAGWGVFILLILGAAVLVGSILGIGVGMKQARNRQRGAANSAAEGPQRPDNDACNRTPVRR